jgi:hypothetical protein
MAAATAAAGGSGEQEVDLKVAAAKHFAWLERILRFHPDVCVSEAEVAKAVQWAEAVVEQADHENQHASAIVFDDDDDDDDDLEMDGAGGGGGGGHASPIPAAAATQSPGSSSTMSSQQGSPEKHSGGGDAHKNKKRGGGHHRSGGRGRRHGGTSGGTPGGDAQQEAAAAMARMNPVKVMALKHDSIVTRAVASLCGNSALVVRHRIAVETSPWSCTRVARDLLVLPDTDQYEAIQSRDQRMALVEEAELAEFATEMSALAAAAAAAAEGAAGVEGGQQQHQQPPGSANKDKKSSGDGDNTAGGGAAAVAAGVVSASGAAAQAAVGSVHKVNTGGRLPVAPFAVYGVDVSKVPVLFKRQDVKAAVAAHRGKWDPDAALAALHASVKALQELHGPARLTKLGLAGALPLRTREAEEALRASRGDLAAALDLLVLDRDVRARFELWRVRSRVCEVLAPAAAKALKVGRS